MQENMHCADVVTDTTIVTLGKKKNTLYVTSLPSPGAAGRWQRPGPASGGRWLVGSRCTGTGVIQLLLLPKKMRVQCIKYLGVMLFSFWSLMRTIKPLLCPYPWVTSVNSCHGFCPTRRLRPDASSVAEQVPTNRMMVVLK